MECNICCSETTKSFFVCKNKECQMKTCCVECLKRYLLTKSSEPHCMSCRIEIPTTDFIVLFSRNWRLGVYKEHCKNILWAKEQSRMGEALAIIDRDTKLNKVKEKIDKVNKEIYNLENKINLIKQEILKNKDNKLFKSEDYLKLGSKSNSYYEKISLLKKEKLKYFSERREIQNRYYQNNPLHSRQVKTPTINLYKYKCPDSICNGSLNDEYNCVSCQKKYCKDCFEILNENHECNEDLKATVLQIKKEAKPCPNCGTMISKISGCSQLFCTNINCGTAFNWNTGEIEKGIIHNPEAYGYYARNPEAREAYLNRINNINDTEQGNCARENRVTQLQISRKINELNLPIKEGDYFSDIIRNLYNFRFYRYDLFNDRENLNLDLRLRYCKNLIDEKSFKKTLHMRYKKKEKRRIEKDILLTTTYVLNDLLQLVLVCKTPEELLQLKDREFKEIIKYTNDELEKNANYFGNKPLLIDKYFYIR